ncbi:membrane protein [Longimycelium tulufanense]|uniref:Membrane protein n=1 Tax=Longimycelium tulufanense TaxID=907463 RepID=A0A8J3CGL8_9PSEU|nr:PH domain-containing protein [Longimycelium tulufanense]GGM72718.1 membrane protein [Longimycelium tulufanense]
MAKGDTGPRLRPPRHRASPRAITWWTIDAAIGWLVLLLPQVVALLVWGSAKPWLTLTVIGTLVVGALHTAVMPQWRYRVHRWEATREAVFARSGWFNQEWRIAPVSRIQTVDTERGALQQLLGLATVTVTTASAAGPVKIAGLDVRTAQELVDELTRTTMATPGDAT